MSQGTAARTVTQQTITHDRIRVNLVTVGHDTDEAVAADLRIALAVEPATVIIVDLSRSGDIGPMGLHVMTAARRTARDRGGDLLLSAVPPALRSTLDATRLSAFFPVFDAFPQAMTAALTGRSPRTPAR